MPKLTIGRYTTSEDDCIIPAEFTISFNNVEKDRFEGVFSKYRVLYVDYDANRLSVRLPEEEKFIPAAAAEIEKLMDYAHLFEEGDLEISEPSEISPEEFIKCIRRSVPSTGSYSRRSHPSAGNFSAESHVEHDAVPEPLTGGIQDGGEDLNEKIPDLIEEEPTPVALAEDLVPDYSEIPVDISPGPEEPISFDDLDDIDLDLLPDSEEGVPESVELLSSETPVSEEPISFDDLDDIDLDLLPDSEEEVPESVELLSFETPVSEEPISFDDLEDMDMDLLPDSEETAPELDELQAEGSGLSQADEGSEVLLSAGDFPEIEGFDDEFNLEGEKIPDLSDVDIPVSDSLIKTEAGEFSGEESSGFEFTDEFSDLDDLVEESAADTLLVEANDLIAEGKYEDAANVLGKSVLEKSGSAELWVRRGEVCALAGQIPDASESYEKALELDPENMTTVLSLYRIYKENENYNCAAKLLDSYIKKNPEDSNLWFEKGQISEKSGEFGEAFLDYDQAISLDAGCTRAIASKALLLMREKRPEEALECYDLLILRRPDNAAVYHSRGLVLKVLGKYDDAVDSFKEAIRLDPSDSDTLLEIAILLLETGRFRDALGYYNRLIGAGVSGSEIFSGQGDAYLALGMTVEALSAYENAIESGGNNLGALKGKADILAASGNLAEAVEVYKNILDLNPLDKDVLQKLASLYESTGRPELALSAYEKILIAIPADPSAIYGRIKNLVSLERYPEAIPLYDSLIVTDPKRSDLISGKAFSLARAGRKDEAVVLYISALQLEPENIGYLLELVTVLSDLGRYAESLSYYDRLISLVPGEYGFVMSRALALYTLGRYEDAVAGFEDVLQKKPDDMDALINMGTALFRLGERRRAIGCYKRSIDVDPSLEEEWLKRGISASSFIEWEIDRIQSIPKSPAGPGSGHAVPKPRIVKEKEEDISHMDGVSASGMEQMESESVNVTDARIQTKEKLGDPDYLYKKGLALARKGYYRASLKCFDRIETLTEDCSEAVFSKGIIYAKNGYYTEALECFERVLDMNPSHEKAQKAKRMVEIKKNI